MVKAVIGEETRLQLTEDRLSKSSLPTEVGLVIGKLSAALDRGFVFDLIPTPPNDAGEAPCSIVDGAKGEKKGSKSKTPSDASSELFIDKDWIAEHARQVSRLLVGGIKVVGIYVWVGESGFKNSTLVLCQTVKAVADAAPLLGSAWDERLLVHICYSPRRWTCRNCSLASNITSSSLRPCDFKMGKVLNSLQAFRCLYTFDIRLPISRENASNIKTLNDVLRDGILMHARDLKGAKPVINGNLVQVLEDEPCTSDGLHEVELLLPFMKDVYLEASSQKEVVGVLVYTGAVCSYAYLNSKEPFSQALADIKEDIITSMRSRLDIIFDEAEREIAATVESGGEANGKASTEQSVYQFIIQPLRKQCRIAFPRRVFIPWLAGTYICDYLQPSETLEVVKDHIVELLSMESPKDSSKILEPERETPPSLSTESFWDMAAPLHPSMVSRSICKDDATRKSTVAKSLISGDFKFLVAAGLVLLLSVLVGLVLYRNNRG